jgi:uncharacterized membrane protein
MALIRQGDLEDKAGVKRFIVIPAVLLVLSATAPGAKAELRYCNKTSSRISIAVGYKEVGKDWVTEGWWNAMPGGCDVLIPGPLHGKFYYVYAVDSDRGGEWSGHYPMCTQNKMFTISGSADCEKRGFMKKGFFEIDTGELPTWLVQLDESGRTGHKP